jgi:hypothetical protein
MTLKTSERINVEANRSELCQLTTPIKTVVYLAKEGECDPGKKGNKEKLLIQSMDFHSQLT